MRMRGALENSPSLHSTPCTICANRVTVGPQTDPETSMPITNSLMRLPSRVSSGSMMGVSP